MTDSRFDDLDPPGQIYNLFSILYDLARVAGWEPYNLHDLADDFWIGWICTLQILHSLSQREVRF